MQQEASWIAFGMAALSMVATAIAAWNARKVARDKLEFDAKVVTLEARVADQGADIKRCEEERADLRQSVDKCQDEHEATRQALDHEREARHRLEVRVASLERQNGSTGNHA